MFEIIFKIKLRKLYLNSIFIITFILVSCSNVRDKSVYSCGMHSKQKIKLEIFDDVPFVNVKIDGVKFNMILDTGSDATVLFEKSIKKNPDHKFSIKNNLIMNSDITINQDIYEATPISIISESITSYSGMEFDGLIGRSLFKIFSIDIDFPLKYLTLWQENDCTAGQIAQAFSGYLLDRPQVFEGDHRPYISVEVDEQRLVGLIDTGAPYTVMEKASARKFF